MNELAAIKKHLGVCTTDAQLNHYTLIGLSPKASAIEIKQALKSAIAAWNSSDKSSDPESAQHVAKLIKQAQSVLLDEVKKKEYDGTLAASSFAPSKAFLPESDPYAPFDPSQCLDGMETQPPALSFGSIEERWDELSRQIQILNEPASVHPSLAVATLPILPQRMVPAAQPASAESAATRIERLKRSRQRKQSLYLAAFLIFALGFLGFAGFMFVRNRQQLAQQNEANAIESAKAPGLAITKETAPKTTTPKTIGGKNAPKGNSSESTFVLPTLSKEESSMEPGMGISMASPLSEAPMNPAGIAPAPEPMKPDESMKPADSPKPANSTEPTSAGPTSAGPIPAPSMKPETPINPVPEKPMDAMPSAASRMEWVAVMKKAREAVEKADFKTFHQQIELALPLSVSEEMSAKRARLDQLGQLYEIFIKAMQEAKTKMKGAESFTVGKMTYSIVEVKENELIVRKDGNNVKYAWDRLPPGIANAMADLALSNSEPTDVAARAVYFSLSPAKNDLFAKRVKEWFDKSVGKGSIREDLVQALTDTYE